MKVQYDIDKFKDWVWHKGCESEYVGGEDESNTSLGSSHNPLQFKQITEGWSS
jgi:hypothetical protein